MFDSPVVLFQGRALAISNPTATEGSRVVGLGDPKCRGYEWQAGVVSCLRVDEGVLNGFAGDLVNPAGDVVGGARDAASGGSIGGFQAAGTDVVTPLAPVESLAGTSGIAQAYGINSSRLVVGFSDSRSGEIPVSWSAPGGAPRPLPVLSSLPAPSRSGWAFSVNDAGRVVGSEYATLCAPDRKTCAGGRYGVLWTATTARNLGTLTGTACPDGSAPHCGGSSEARAINDRGEIVGASTVGNTSHAFLWKNGVMTDLGTLDTRTGSQVGAVALAINDSDAVVGASSFATPARCPSDRQAFIYLNGKIQKLENLLPESARGWQLVAATGISNAGDVVGWGYPPGGCAETAFLLRPKSPWMVITPSSLDAAQGQPRDQAALDFANQSIRRPSPPARLTVTNSGAFDLRVGKVAIVRGNGQYEITDAGDCTDRAIPPDGSCTIDVTFTPTAGGQIDGELAVFSDSPGDNPEYVSLSGIGTSLLLAPATVAESAATHFTTHCLTSLKFAGWKLLSEQPQQLTGEVVQAHVASEDIHLVPPLLFHNNADSNFFVYPDSPSQRLLATPGNFRTADRYELGRIEVEWERWSTAWPGGFPEWAWPAQGDRVRMIGYHVFDCGHDDQGYRAEIHPPRVVVTYRNAALSRLTATAPEATAVLNTISGRTGSFEGTTAATRVDVFASSYGGEAIDSETGDGWFQPVNQDNYTFTVMAPPKPSPNAVLTYAETDRYRLGVGNLSFDHQRLPNGRGFRVILPFKTVETPAGKLMVFGATIHVYWSGADVPKVPLRHFKVTLTSLHIREALTGNWSLYGSVNNQAAGSLLDAGGGTQANHERYQVVRDGETITHFNHPTFAVTLVPGEPLHIAFRASAWTRSGLLIPAGASDFMGTAEAISLDPPAEQTIASTADLAVGHEDDVDKACATACFTVTVTITKS